MRLEIKYPVMIFAKEYQDKMLYNMGINKKDNNDKYVNGYISCKFKKDVKIQDRTKIKVNDAWLDFYVKDKKTNLYVFINDFTLLDADTNKSTNETAKDEFVITDEELPF